MSASSSRNEGSTDGTTSRVPFPPLLNESLKKNYLIASKLVDETYGHEAQNRFAALHKKDPRPSTLAYSQLMERLAKELIRERCTQPDSASGESSIRDSTRILKVISDTPKGWQHSDGSNGETAAGISDLHASAISAYALLNVCLLSASDDGQTQGDSADITEKGDGEATSKATGWGWGSTIAAGIMGTGLTAATAYGALRLKEWYEGTETVL